MQLEIPWQDRKLRCHGVRIGSGEFVVYHFIVKSLVRFMPDGEMVNENNERGYVLESFATA
jgi:hypothetical protein